MLEGINKTYLYGAIALVGVGFLFLKPKNSAESDVQKMIEDAGVDVSYGNDTMFIPTSTTNIDYVAGNQEITNTDNRSTTTQNNTATDGGVISNPVTTPVVTIPTPAKPTVPATQKLTLTAKTSLFKTADITGTPIGSLAPQTVEVLAQQNDLYQIKSYVGNAWLKPNYFKTNSPTQTSTYKTYTMKKGDTLWHIAQVQLGNPKRWTEIAKLNGITDEKKIPVGKVLKIPNK